MIAASVYTIMVNRKDRWELSTEIACNAALWIFSICMAIIPLVPSVPIKYAPAGGATLYCILL